MPSSLIDLRAAAQTAPAAMRSAVVPGLRRWPSDAEPEVEVFERAFDTRRRRASPRPALRRADRLRLLGDLRPAFAQDQTVGLRRQLTQRAHGRSPSSSGQPRATPSSIHCGDAETRRRTRCMYCRATRSRSARQPHRIDERQRRRRIVEHVGLSALAQAARRRDANRFVDVPRVVERESLQARRRCRRPAASPSRHRGQRRDSSSVPRFVFVPTASRVARTASSTVRPTPSSRARSMIGPIDHGAVHEVDVRDVVEVRAAMDVARLRRCRFADARPALQQRRSAAKSSSTIAEHGMLSGRAARRSLLDLLRDSVSPSRIVVARNRSTIAALRPARLPPPNGRRRPADALPPAARLR